jgi:hypothetical protein
MSTFNEATLSRLEKRFGLQEIQEHQLLTNWLTSEAIITDEERKELLKLQKKHSNYIYSYNESELTTKVITPIINLVDFETEYSWSFLQRELSAVIDGELLNGKPDLMIAKGTKDPEMPYFCLHEYKRAFDNSGDPAGQCLAAMLVAQELNHAQRMIYGAFVVGADWFFMILKDKTYSVSSVYVVTKLEIFDIFRILKAMKNQIISNATNS